MHSICTRAPQNNRSECMRWFLERIGSKSRPIIIIIGVCPLQHRRVVHIISIVGVGPIDIHRRVVHKIDYRSSIHYLYRRVVHG